MEHTLVYSLPRLEQPFGPDQAATLHLAGHAKLNVQFTYEPGYTGAAYDAGGEPGSDPGAPEFFDFKQILTIDPLVLVSGDGKVRTVDGRDIPIAFDSVCIHSDTPGALALVQATRKSLEAADIAIAAPR